MDNHWSASIPRSVKVGYRIYSIEVFEAMGARSQLGEHLPWAHQIKIYKDQPASEAANTLVHEIMHACYDIFGVRTGDKEERLVETVANAISTVWIDSPEVMEWIGQRLVGAKQ